MQKIRKWKIHLTISIRNHKMQRREKMERKLKIITEKCPQNHKCPAVNVCPVGALTQTNFEAPKIDYDKCISCKMCMVKCPVNNFIEENGKPKAQGKCTCCYRCISNCPKQAITLIGKEIYEQSKIEKYLG